MGHCRSEMPIDIDDETRGSNCARLGGAMAGALRGFFEACGAQPGEEFEVTIDTGLRKRLKSVTELRATEASVLISKAGRRRGQDARGLSAGQGMETTLGGSGGRNLGAISCINKIPTEYYHPIKPPRLIWT